MALQPTASATFRAEMPSTPAERQSRRAASRIAAFRLGAALGAGARRFRTLALSEVNIVNVG